jgi:hypothetical protein
MIVKIERMNPVIIIGSNRRVWNSGKAKEKTMASAGPEIYRRRKGRKAGIFQFFPWPTIRFRSRRIWLPYRAKLALSNVDIENGILTE